MSTKPIIPRRRKSPHQQPPKEAEEPIVWLNAIEDGGAMCTKQYYDAEAPHRPLMDEGYMPVRED